MMSEVPPPKSDPSAPPTQPDPPPAEAATVKGSAPKGAQGGAHEEQSAQAVSEGAAQVKGEGSAGQPARPRRWRKRLAWLAGVGAVYGLALSALALSARPRAPSEGGALIFSDDFNRAQLGPDWRQSEPDQGWPAGTWRIEEDRLVAEKIRNAALWLQKPLPQKVRIEFKARAHTPDGDVKCEVFGDGRTHQSGYVAIHGGWRNAVNIIARQDEHGEDRKQEGRCGGPKPRCVEPDVDYLWTIERDDDTVRWYLDGALFLTYPDRHPVQGQHFAFNNWEAKVSFDDLKIYDLSR